MSKEMLLIYADEQLNDIGVLQDYSFDECYGDDDNTFQLKVQTANHVCHEGYYVYIEFTEYGGIIDRIESDTKKGEVTYIGRTWHGILNSFVIEPPSGQMYRTFNGTANTILGQMISLFGLGSLFIVDGSDTPNNEIINIYNFQCRYEKMYDAIKRMLSENNGKFRCYFKNSQVHIYSRLFVNYTMIDEFDTTQVPFQVGQTYNQVNHLICLGQGNGVDRAVIHLFIKDDGIQPYKTVEEPIKDSQYILDKSQQYYTGMDEITEIYDYPNAEIITNYEKLSTEPSDWNANYYKKYYFFDNELKDYALVPQKFVRLFNQLTGTKPPTWDVDNGYQQYFFIENGKYVNVRSLTDQQASVEFISMTAAHGYTTAPERWEDNYSIYYTRDAELNYVQVKSVRKQGVDYYARDQKPSDWDANYSQYSKRYQQGQEYLYTPVQGVTRVWAELQAQKPTDWNTNYMNYAFYNNQKGITLTFPNAYGVKNHSVILNSVIMGNLPVTYILFSELRNYLNSLGVPSLTWEYISDGKPPKWEKKKFYTPKQETVAPFYPSAWDMHDDVEQGIYRVYDKSVAPDFVNDGRYFYKKVNTTPVWYGDGRYWELVDEHHEQIPTFSAGAYYVQVQDRMKTLVEGGIARLKKLCDTSSLNVDLELTEDYDVGDIIGSIDEVTGIKVNKFILRKIIKIKKGILSVEHQVE